MKRLNEIRRAHPALHQLRNLRFHHSEHESLLVFSKRDAASGDTILVVCTTDPHNVCEGWIHLRLDELGVGPEGYTVSDLLSGESYEWDEHAFVRLGPDHVAHVFTVRPH